MEGLAPSAELKSAFASFKQWLVDIYRAVSNICYQDADGGQQAFEISNAVRGVMDRMLASDDEISAYRMSQGDPEMLRQQMIKSGVSAQDAAAIIKLAKTSDETAKANLFKKLAQELSSRRQQRIEADREARREQALTRLSEEPRYKTFAALTEGATKLSKEDLIERFGEAAVQGLSSELFAAKESENSLDTALAAELFGYDSAEALLTDMQLASTVTLE